MRGFRILLLTAALLLPSATWAVPVSIDLYGWSSYIHQANGCPGSGFFMCGTPAGFVSGSLLADRDGQLLSDITGDVTILGVDYAVSGALDFGAATQGGVAGSLTIGSLGAFDFWNETVVSDANSLDGTDLHLWGQNFARYLPAPPQGGLGIHLNGTVSETDGGLGQPTEGGGQVPAVPEPGSAALFGLGTLVVMIRGRRA